MTIHAALPDVAARPAGTDATWSTSLGDIHTPLLAGADGSSRNLS